jgi:methylated-DNA-[protein]-cysteine S-methyltransferase
MMDTLHIWIERIATAQLGDVWVAFSDRGLVTVEYKVSRVAFEAHVRRQTHRDISPATRSEQEAASDAACQIAEYLQGRRRVFEIQINWSVMKSEFQRTALRAVAIIPYGEIRTYGQIAAEIGYPQAPRAMGRANATNPMPLVIPCHRVVGSDGKLHGYGGAGGLKTKQWLLHLEGAPMPRPSRSILAHPRI